MGHAAWRLEGAGLEGPRNEAFALLGELLGVSRSELLLSRNRSLSSDELGKLEAWLERREAREPLQKAVDRPHSCSPPYAVSAGVVV